MIYYGKQNINQEDINTVVSVLQSDFLTQGPMIERFEECVADYCGVKYAVAVSNATAALHIACLSAGLGVGDMLWTSPNTFVASANCARYCGADVDFVDIDNDNYNMSLHELEIKLESAKVKPKVVIPVHFAGQSCDMQKIKMLANKYKFAIIEDASHCIGGDYASTKIGSCEYSDMTVFSFHPVKIITTGEGGMVLTNSKELYDKLRLYRSHGITRDQKLLTNSAPWYYEQIDLGFNYRMTEIQAALGLSQMNRLEEFIYRRRYLADRYSELLAGSMFKLPDQDKQANSSWHLYVLRYDFEKVALTKQELFEKMKEQGVTLNLHYIPVHLQPYYKQLGLKKGDCPTSEKYYEEVFTIPLYYGLTDKDQEYIVKCLKNICE